VSKNGRQIIALYCIRFVYVVEAVNKVGDVTVSARTRAIKLNAHVINERYDVLLTFGRGNYFFKF